MPIDLPTLIEVHRRLLEARERGAGVLLISEDLDEILALSDRVVAIHDLMLSDAGREGSARFTEQLTGLPVELLPVGTTVTL